MGTTSIELLERYKNIPDELKKLKQWVCWCGEKLPKNALTGKNAQSNNEDTWTTFENAIIGCVRYNFDGLGFMFANGYCGVDLDHCIENIDFCDEFTETLGTYNEYSKSKKGLHFICKGQIPEGMRRKNNVEMYDFGRYFIMTGNLYNDKYKKIVDCNNALKILHNKYLPQQIIHNKILEKFEISNLSNEEVIQKARDSKSGTLFQLLYAGQWESLFSSQSEADLSFCFHLAFWTQKNKEQMDSIFRNSGLMREKWDRKQSGTTYGNITIEKACLQCEEVYIPKFNQDDNNILVSFKENKNKSTAQKVKYDLNDSGNGKRFRDKFNNSIKYSYNRQNWYIWNGKNYVFDNDGMIKRLADTVIDDLKSEAFNCEFEDQQKILFKFANKLASSSSKKAMITETQHLDNIAVNEESFNLDESLINTQNGVINLKNGEFLKHDQKYMMSNITLCDSEINAKKPKRWLKFLNDITEGDQELQHYLKVAIGYSLTGLNVEQCAFFMYGNGNNGKSTFLYVLSSILGDYSKSISAKSLMVGKQSDNTSDIARLHTARFVISEETQEGVRLDESKIKEITGGSKVVCRFLFKDDFEYEPKFKFWMATNHKPIIRGTDKGIWRRIKLIPLTADIPTEKLDKMLKYKLAEEYPLILQWAIEGAIEWFEKGLKEPKCVVEATAEYRNEMDSITTFVNECCDVTNDSNDVVDANYIYSIFKLWAKTNNEYEISNRKFGIEFVKKFKRKRTNKGNVYCGLKVLVSFSDFIS